jgi:phosphopantetheine adenylyltransferase
MTTITNNKNNIKKSLLDDLFVDEILNEKKTNKKESIDIQDYSSDEEQSILKKKKSSIKAFFNRKLDITKPVYKKINERYSIATYSGVECIMDMKTGYINATKFCCLVSDETKKFDSYINTDRYKNLVEYSGYLSILVEDGVNRQIHGTYLHPDLLLDLASWISPSAYIKASRIVSNDMLSEKEYEIRKLKDDKYELIKMLDESEKVNKQLIIDMKVIYGITVLIETPKTNNEKLIYKTVNRENKDE